MRLFFLCSVSVCPAQCCNSLRRVASYACLTACCLLFGIPLAAHAQKSRTKITTTTPAKDTGGAATPSAGSKTTFTIAVDQNYCDVSLPYSYSSTEKDLTLTIGSSIGWTSILKDEWNAQPQIIKTKDAPAPPPHINLDFVKKGELTPGKIDDPPVLNSKSKVVELNDSGDALLGDPTHELSTNTFDAQRLLVRTLFGPNPFQVACAYPYLKYPDGTSDGASVDDLHMGPNQTKIPLLGKGAGYPFSLNDPKAPKYYLIDIVRWKDTSPPAGVTVGTQPFFQPASDNWYLLNYADSQARPQDISKWFTPITPSLASDTLRIIGSSKVMFLAIHLAPTPPLGIDENGKEKFPAPPNITGTEQAWYDDVAIKYSIQASTYEPTQIQDLDDLIQILGTYVLGGAAPTVRAPGMNPFPIDNFLRQSSTETNPFILSTYQGRYAAGLLTNLTALPVNLTHTWTATFNASNKHSDGKATAYDTRSPAVLAAAKPATPPSNSASICAVAVDSSDKTKQADCNVTGAKVQNEGLSHWDVSVVVPASSYSDVTFQASTATGGTNSITTSKTVSRTNAYGVFDFFLYPEDLVHPPNVGLPHLIVGLPFAGKVFDKPYFAIGQTFNLPNTLGKLKVFSWIPGISAVASSDLPLSLRPTFGWVFNKVFPTPGTNTSYRSLKPQFGIEISISGLVKTLSKSSSSGTGTTKTTTASTVPPAGS